MLVVSAQKAAKLTEEEQRKLAYILQIYHCLIFRNNYNEIQLHYKGGTQSQQDVDVGVVAQVHAKWI